MSTLEEQYVKGEINGRVSTILAILNNRFKKVPDSILQSLNLYTDSIALDSLAVSAADCKTLEEFEQELAH
jgi:hypothetical protein